MGRWGSDGTEKGCAAYGGAQSAEEPVSLALRGVQKGERMRLQAVSV